jgi:hypothetical protein
MEYLIVGLFFAAVWHFVYQAIWLPTIHMKQRNRLFALRDRLRAYHFDHPDTGHERAFSIAQDGINNCIHSVEVLGLHFQRRIGKRYEKDVAFRESVKERSRTLKDANCAEIDAVVKEANNVLREIFVFNSGGWFVYVVPVALGMIFYQRTTHAAKDLFASGAGDAAMLLQGPRQVAYA